MKFKSVLSVLICFLLVISIAPFGSSALEKEIAKTGGIGTQYVEYVETYEQLKNFVYNSPNGEKYVLQNDIIIEDNKNDQEIIVSSFTDCTLDLNGYTISRTTRGIDSCLIKVNEGASFDVYDSSYEKTGRMIFRSGNYAGTSAVMIVDGDVNIYGGSFEILTPYKVGTGVVFRVEKGYLNIYDGVFDSHDAYGGDTIQLQHNAYLYTVPHCNIYGGTFYGKYSNFEVASYSNFTKYGCFYPSVYVYDGEFYIANPDDEYAGFAYCNNGWGQVIVAGGTKFYKCLNSTDERYIDGVSKNLISVEYEGKTGVYDEVTPPAMIGSDDLSMDDRLSYKFAKKELSYYRKTGTVYQQNQEMFDAVMNYVDTIEVPAAQEESPFMWIENNDSVKTISWYFSDEAHFNGENTVWSELADYRGRVNPFRFDFRPVSETTLYFRALITLDDETQIEDVVKVHYEEMKLNPPITHVSVIYVSEPKAGEHPDFSFATGSAAYYINYVQWKDVDNPLVLLKETDVFEAGHTYELEVWLRTNEGYKFKTDSYDWIDISATVGGKQAEVVPPGSQISAILSVTYTINEPQVVSFVDVTEIDKPYAGNTPDMEAYCSTQGCNVETVEWYDDTDGKRTPITANTKFVEGRVYRVVVGVRAEGNCEYLMQDGYNEATGCINGERNTIVYGSHDETFLELGFVFAPCEKLNVTGLLGDADEDDIVNIKDATAIQKHIAGMTQLTAKGQALADVDSNGKVNILDATLIQKYCAKMTISYPIGEPV